jgi:hypothetical protein
MIWPEHFRQTSIFRLLVEDIWCTLAVCRCALGSHDTPSPECDRAEPHYAVNFPQPAAKRARWRYGSSSVHISINSAPNPKRSYLATAALVFHERGVKLHLWPLIHPRHADRRDSNCLGTGKAFGTMTSDTYLRRPYRRTPLCWTRCFTGLVRRLACYFDHTSAYLAPLWRSQGLLLRRRWSKPVQSEQKSVTWSNCAEELSH